MTFVLFDVGANWGTDSIEVTAENPNYSTYAFEPTPELYDHLKSQTSQYSDRYQVYRIALSDYTGTAKFNVAAHQDWGTSSLLEFSEGLEHTWAGRHDFYVDRVIDVAVMRFDTWFELIKPPIQKIDFFHCDTQGSDLAVLRGMGDYIDFIKEGVVEVPMVPEVKLYKGQHTKEEMEDFLSDHGFEVTRIHYQQNEHNLYFGKKIAS